MLFFIYDKFIMWLNMVFSQKKNLLSLNSDFVVVIKYMSFYVNILLNHCHVHICSADQYK